MSITTIFMESLSQFNQSGDITLYHYSKEGSEQLILDPKEFGKHSFTRQERRTSSFPRVFFYLDPTDKERFFQSNAWNLYTTTVDRRELYDLRKDKKNLINKIKDNNDGVLNYDQLFKTLKKEYNGVYYRVKNRDVVAYFYPISVDKQVPVTA